MIRRLFLLGFVGLLAALWLQPAEALRCGRNLVKEGDPVSRAVRYCPEPFWVERWEAPGPLPVPGGFGYQPYPVVTDAFEAWYINFGPRKLMRRLLFRNGYLQQEQTLDYGFSRLPVNDCSALDLEQAGDTIGSVYAHCGPPDHEYSYPHTINTGRPGTLGQAITVYRYVWTYYPRNGLPRELHFQEGQLVRSVTQRR